MVVTSYSRAELPYAMTYLSMPWYTTLCRGMPLYVMAYPSMPWHSILCHGIPLYVWQTPLCHGILLGHMANPSTPFHTPLCLANPSMPWHTSSMPWHTPHRQRDQRLLCNFVGWKVRHEKLNVFYDFCFYYTYFVYRSTYLGLPAMIANSLNNFLKHLQYR